MKKNNAALPFAKKTFFNHLLLGVGSMVILLYKSMYRFLLQKQCNTQCINIFFNNSFDLRTRLKECILVYLHA